MEDEDGNAEIHSVTSVSDLLHDARVALDDADPETGKAPVYESVVDVQPTEPEAAPVVLRTWTAEQRARLLSRMPCEFLADLLPRYLGRSWWDHEDEVILEEISKLDVILDAGGINKVRALKTLLTSEPSAYHRNAASWIFLTVCLSGRPIRWEDASLPTPLEAALGMLIAAEMRPEPYSVEVLSAVAACCIEDNLWCLPGILAAAQGHLIRIGQIEGIPVTKEMVDAARSLVARELAGDFDAIPEQVTTPLEFQALRAWALHLDIEQNQERVEQLRETVRKVYQKD